MITIRPATVDDADGIGRVSAETWLATYRGLMPDSILDSVSVEGRIQRYREILAEPASPRSTFVAVDGGHVVGFAAGGAERTGAPPHPPAGGGSERGYTGELYALYVLPPYHGQGIGRRLVAAVVERLRAQGHAAMLVWVLAGNPARGFYQHLGGQFVGHKHLPIQDATLLEEGYGFTFDTLRL
ncbi:MAG: GNAT family N-acetyltransferase [Anaerolineae bacterium]